MLDLLTRREREVAELVAEGLTNYEIGRRLWIEEQTVKYHVQNACRSTGVRNRTELAAMIWRERVAAAAAR